MKISKVLAILIITASCASGQMNNKRELAQEKSHEDEAGDQTSASEFRQFVQLTDNCIVDTFEARCFYPKLEDLQKVKATYLKNRSKVLDKINQTLSVFNKSSSSALKLADDYEKQNGKNTFSKAYRDFSKSILQSVVILELNEGKTLFAENSPFVKHVDKAISFVKKWGSESDTGNTKKAEAYMEIMGLNDRDAYYQSVHLPEKFISELESDGLELSEKSIDFDFNKYIKFDNCNFYSGFGVLERKVFSEKAVVSPIKDWKIFAKILDGVGNKAMTVKCNKVRNKEDISVYYREQDGVLEYKFYQKLSFGGIPMPGTSTTLFEKNVKTPSVAEVIEALK